MGIQQLQTSAKQAPKPCPEHKIVSRVEAFKSDGVNITYTVKDAETVDFDCEGASRVGCIAYDETSEHMALIDQHILNYFQPIMEDMFSSRPNPLRIPLA